MRPCRRYSGYRTMTDSLHSLEPYGADPSRNQLPFVWEFIPSGVPPVGTSRFRSRRNFPLGCCDESQAGCLGRASCLARHVGHSPAILPEEAWAPTEAGQVATNSPRSAFLRVVDHWYPHGFKTARGGDGSLQMFVRKSQSGSINRKNHWLFQKPELLKEAILVPVNPTLNNLAILETVDLHARPIHVPSCRGMP